MPIDIFDDVSAPESPAPAWVVPVAPQKPAVAGSGSMASWVASALLLCLCVLVGLLLYRPADGDGDDIKPPAVSGLHVLVVEETGQRNQLPEGQIAIFTSPELRDWYGAHCAKEDGGGIAYRNYDVQDKPETEGWKKLRDLVTEPPPCVLVAEGKRAAHFRLPADPGAMKAKLDEFKANRR